MKTIIKIVASLSVILLFTANNLYGSPPARLDNVAKEKRNKPGWIGVVIQDVDKKIARKARLESTDGAYIKEVLDDSPADSAGLCEGDVIIDFSGKKIFDADDLSKAVRKTPPGTKVNINIIRDGEKKQINLTVAKRNEIKNRGFNMVPGMMNLRVFTGNEILGLRLITLNEQLGEYFNAPNNEGVLIEEVKKESAGEKAGFIAGDVIIRIGKKTIGDTEKLKRELQRYDDGEIVEIEVLRKGTKKVLNLELEEDEIRSDFFIRKFYPKMERIIPFDDAELQFNIREQMPEL